MDPSSNKTIPPQSTDAEASLLGAILIDSDAIVKVADIVTFEDFYDEKHRRIFEAIVFFIRTTQPNRRINSI